MAKKKVGIKITTRKVSTSGSLKLLLKQPSGGETDLLVGDLDELILREQANKKPWKNDNFHPSGILGCDRALVASILAWEKSKPSFTAQVLNIFELGNEVHARIQGQLIRSGKVPSRPDWKKKAYRDKSLWAIEVPIAYPQWLLKGTCDAIVFVNNNFYLVEIKSMNDFQFMGLREPTSENYAQGQCYLKMAEHSLGIEPKGCIYVYENKNNQTRKEFLVPPDRPYIQRLGSRLVGLKKFVEAQKFPKRPYAKDSKECKRCNFKEWCWKEASS